MIIDDIFVEFLVWIWRVLAAKPGSAERDKLTVPLIILGALLLVAVFLTLVLLSVTQIFQNVSVAVATLGLCGLGLGFVIWWLHRLQKRDEEAGRSDRRSRSKVGRTD